MSNTADLKTGENHVRWIYPRALKCWHPGCGGRLLSWAGVPRKGGRIRYARCTDCGKTTHSIPIGREIELPNGSHVVRPT